MNKNRSLLEELVLSARREAERLEFPIDLPVYQRAGRDPLQPVLCAGSLEAPLCVVGRDLGKDEVQAGEPLIGQAGRLVRRGIVAAWGDQLDSACETDGPERALELALLTNIVPFKPPGNKAYPEAVRRRFRPFLETLLVQHWDGNQVITLGSEAFSWFGRYLTQEPAPVDTGTPERFQRSFRCRIGVDHSCGGIEKTVTVYPLPHPSPLNRRWYSQFSSMLASRLSQVRREC